MPRSDFAASAMLKLKRYLSMKQFGLLGLKVELRSFKPEFLTFESDLQSKQDVLQGFKYFCGELRSLLVSAYQVQ